jgi:hypothetical protein
MHPDVGREAATEVEVPDETRVPRLRPGRLERRDGDERRREGGENQAKLQESASMRARSATASASLSFSGS